MNPLTTPTTPATDAPDPEPLKSLAEAEPLRFDELLPTLWDTLMQWVEVGVRLLPNVVVAVVIVTLAGLAARFFGAVFAKAVGRATDNAQVTSLLCTIVRVVIVGVGVFLALGVLRLDGVVTSLLAGVGVVGIALGFAFQDIAANFMAGVLMALSRPFAIGDLIRTGEHFGTVRHVDLRATKLRTMQGETVVIPNREVFNDALVNYTDTPDRRIDIAVGVAYGDDLRKARQVILDAVSGLDLALDGRTRVDVEGFGGSSVDLVARFWVNARNQAPYLDARSQAVIAIKEALDEAGLHIPFPIRTLDFGASSVGGVRLDEVLETPAPSQDRDAA